MFSEHVNNTISRLLIGIEGERKKRKERMKKLWLYSLIPLVVLGISFLVYPNPVVLIASGVGTLIYIIVIAIIGYSSKMKLINVFKQQVLIPSIKEAYPGVTYAQKASITRDEFVHSQIYSASSVDRFKGEDLFTGKHGDTTFKFSEVHVEERRTRTDSKGRTQTYYVTIFKGIFMIADFNKEIQSHTRVMQASDGFFEKLFAGKTKVSLEDPVFEKMFNTYSKDQVEARYILTPAMMERMIELQKTWGGKTHYSFKGHYMFVAIANSYNHFEPEMKQEVGLDQIKRIFNEIDNCLSIIDTLDLNTRIWTKQ